MARVAELLSEQIHWPLVRSRMRGQYLTMRENMSSRGLGDFAKLGQLIRDIRVALLTTMDRDGNFHTRPVQTLQVASDQALWFFTDWSSSKVDELNHDVRVSLGYADPAKNVYCAVSGLGRLLRDIQKAKQLWSMTNLLYRCRSDRRYHRNTRRGDWREPKDQVICCPSPPSGSSRIALRPSRASLTPFHCVRPPSTLSGHSCVSANLVAGEFVYRRCS